MGLGPPGSCGPTRGPMPTRLDIPSLETLIVQDWDLAPPDDGEIHSGPSRYYDVTLSSGQTQRDNDHEDIGIRNEKRESDIGTRITGIVI